MGDDSTVALEALRVDEGKLKGHVNEVVRSSVEATLNGVAQVRFVEWTAEGRLRHAAFLGLRSDKSAREVRREANNT